MNNTYWRVKSENISTILVGSGSSAPMFRNMEANVGMTNVIMKMMTRTATLMMVAG